MICELVTDVFPPLHRTYDLTTTALYCFLQWQHTYGDRPLRIDEAPFGKNASLAQNEARHLQRSRDPYVLMRFQDGTGPLSTAHIAPLYCELGLVAQEHL